MLSDDLQSRLDRHVRALGRFYLWSESLWKVATLLTAALVVMGFLLPFTLEAQLVFIAVVLVVALLSLRFFRSRFRKTSWSRLVRMGKAEGILNALQSEYPELVALKDVMELVNEEKEEVSSRRGFWIGFWQSAFFLVLGILISYALARLGWLR